MATHRLGIIMHGITGRMGYNQHLVRSILAIRDQGGVALPNGDRVMPDPILVGRNAEKIAEIAARHGIARTVDRPRRRARQSRRHVVLRRRLDPDAGRPARQGDRGRQARLLRKADRGDGRATRWRSRGSPRRAASRTASCRTSSICPACARSPCCATPASSAASCRCAASSATGCSKATGSRRSGRAGTTARPTAAASSSICCCHWRYVLDNLFGAVKAVSCLGATHIPERVDEAGKPYRGRCRRCRLCDLRARGRRRRPHQLVLVRARAARRPRHLPGRRHARLGGRRADPLLHASIASTRRGRCGTPTSRRRSTFDDQWDEVPDNQVYDNGFKAQWEEFIRHVVAGAPWKLRPDRGRQGRAARRARL